MYPALIPGSSALSLTSLSPLRPLQWTHSVYAEGWRSAALFLLILGSLCYAPEGVLASEAVEVRVGVYQILRGVFDGLALLCCLPIARSMKFSRLKLGRLLLAYVSLCLFSTIWSANPLMTFGKSAEMLIGAFVCLSAASSRDGALKSIRLSMVPVSVMAVLVWISLAGYLLHLDGFRAHRNTVFSPECVASPFLSDNGFGYAAASLLLMTFVAQRRKMLQGWDLIACYAVYGVALGVAGSRTSLGIAVVAVLYMAMQRSFAIGMSVLVVALSVILATWERISRFFLQGHDFEFFLTLSGRREMWSAMWETWGRSPVFGYGAGVGSKVVLATTPFFADTTISSAHNGFLEVLTGTGLVGFALFSALFCRTLTRSVAELKNNSPASPVLALAFVIFATTLMSIGAGGWMGAMMAVFFCLVGIADASSRSGHSQSSFRHAFRVAGDHESCVPACPTAGANCQL